MISVANRPHTSATPAAQRNTRRGCALRSAREQVDPAECQRESHTNGSQVEMRDENRSRF